MRQPVAEVKVRHMVVLNGNLKNRYNMDIDFGEPDRRPFLYVTAFGIGARAMLYTFCQESDIWLKEYTADNDNNKDVVYMIVIVDDYVHMPHEYENIRKNHHAERVTIVDLADSPADIFVRKNLSYLWISKGDKGLAVRDFLRFFNDSIIHTGFLCLDFHDWWLTVKGRNRVFVLSHPISENEVEFLNSWPCEVMPNGKCLVLLKTSYKVNEKHEVQQPTKILEAVSKFFDRLGENNLVNWQISSKNYKTSGSINLILVEEIK